MNKQSLTTKNDCNIKIIVIINSDENIVTIDEVFMKKTLLFGVTLLTLLTAGCSHQHDYYLTVTKDADWRTFITGKDFDDTGLEVALKCSTCGDTKVIDYDLENCYELELDQEDILIIYKDYSISYPITVKNKYRIACVGDSLTKGHYWPNQSYPSYLSQYVSSDYEVGNYGENGISITGYGGSWNDPTMSYIKQHFYTDSLDFKPDIIAMMLGTNDATGWANAQATFIDEYRKLLDAYLEALPNVKIIMMVSPPTVFPNMYSIPNDTIRDYVNPIQRELAEEYGFDVLDLREEFEATPNYISLYLRPNNDNVHFTEAGSQFVATRVWDIVQDIRF
jgi:lysophospholipase L1-like esterase